MKHLVQKYKPALYYQGSAVTGQVLDVMRMSGGCQDDMSLLVIMSTQIDSSIIFNN